MGEESEISAMIRVRMSANDAHYGGQLVNGARMLSLFGDVAAELAINCDGDEGLQVSHDVNFLLKYSSEITLREKRKIRCCRRIVRYVIKF